MNWYWGLANVWEPKMDIYIYIYTTNTGGQSSNQIRSSQDTNVNKHLSIFNLNLLGVTIYACINVKFLFHSNICIHFGDISWILFYFNFMLVLKSCANIVCGWDLIQKWFRNNISECCFRTNELTKALFVAQFFSLRLVYLGGYKKNHSLWIFGLPGNMSSGTHTWTVKTMPFIVLDLLTTK